MIRIALYDSNVEESRNLRRVLRDFAGSKGVFGLGFHVGNSYDAFIDIVQRMQPGFFNVAVVRVSPVGDEVLPKLSNLLDILAHATPQTEVVILSNDANHALDAYEVGARFLRVPFDETGFFNTIGKSLLHAAAVDKRPLPVKSGKSVMVLNLNDVMFAETGKRGPIIHLPQGRLVPVQGTLQALFDKLRARSDQFLRAGGSFIVNLDNIRTASDDSVIFSNGEAIILPVRSRKPVIDAFSTWKVRA